MRLGLTQHLICLASVLVSISLGAQHALYQSNIDIPAAAIQNKGVVLSQPASGINNPAHLSLISSNSVSCFIYPYVRVSGLLQLGLQGNYKLNSRQAVGISLGRWGSKDLNELILGIASSRRISNKTHIGIGVQWYQKHYPESGSSWILMPDVGIQTEVHPKLILGFFVRNPIPFSIQKDVKSESLFRVGICFKPYDQLRVYASIDKSGSLPVSGAIGLEFSIQKSITISTGFNTFRNYAFGFQWKIGNMNIFSSSEIHFITGIKTGIGIQYHFIR